jgi:hypothetical protein
LRETISSTADLRTLWNLDFTRMDTELLPKKDEWATAWDACPNPVTRTSPIIFTELTILHRLAVETRHAASPQCRQCRGEGG